MALTKIGTNGVKDDAVTSGKIADDAVGAEHIEQLDADLSFADSAKAKFGAGNDLQIYHDGSDSYIVDSGTGDLMIRSTDDLKLQNADGSESFLHCNDGGDVILYRAGTERLRTTAYGTKFTNGRIELPDESGHQFQIGAIGDFTMEHDGSNTYLKNITGNTVLQNDAAVEITASSGGTKRFRFDTDGLKFGSDTAAANALDDYEEGTWTPVWSDASSGGTAATTNQAHGRYTKIGRVVHLHFYTWSIQSQGTSNSMYLQGLPFASIGGFSFIGSVGGRYWNQGDDNQYNLQVRVNANNSYGNLEWAESHSGDGVAATFDGIVNAYTNFTCTLTYLTDS